MRSSRFCTLGVVIGTVLLGTPFVPGIPSAVGRALPIHGTRRVHSPRRHLEIRDGAGEGYRWVECSACDTAWPVPHYADAKNPGDDEALLDLCRAILWAGCGQTGTCRGAAFRRKAVAHVLRGIIAI
jgi:hypothetical protein